MKFFLASFAFVFFSFISCRTHYIPNQGRSQLSMTEEQAHLLDSILQFGLDHEALYTLIGDVKPMSSLVSFYYPIANTDSSLKTKGQVLDVKAKQPYLKKIQTIQKLMAQLNFPDLDFVVLPYQSAQGEMRIVQLSVVRVSKLDSLLQKQQSFFGQFGLVPGADPVVVLSMIEGADRYERNRGYGYLFGYPDHAIDFFIDATETYDKTGDFVKRNFFNIPAYAGREGFFVYANASDYKPSIIDSTIYYKSQSILEDYSKSRSKYLNSDSTVRAYKLLQDYYSGKIK